MMKEILTKRLTDNLHHLPLGFFAPGPESCYGRYTFIGDDDYDDNKNRLSHQQEEMTNVDELREKDNEIKHTLVMSGEEQEALAKMNSITSQLHMRRSTFR